MTRGRFWPRSLRGRLFAAIALTALAAAGVTLVTGSLLTRRSLEREALRSLERHVEILAAREEAAHPAPESVLGRFLETAEERLTILSLSQAAFLLPTDAAARLAAGLPARGRLSLRGQAFLYAAAPTEDEALVLLRPARLQAADWRPFALGLGLASLAGIGLAALVALLVARAIARPVRRVADASRDLAEGRTPRPLARGGGSELDSLATSFNRLAAALDRAEAAERAFLLSISHELKTPLTAIRGHAEALEDGVVDPAEVGAVVARESARLERLVGDLLDLARLRQRTFSVRDDPVDLGAVVREAVTRHGPQAERFGVALEARVAPGARALGDADRLLQAVSNLVENALRCTPRGGRVSLDARPGRLAVLDTGPGLEPEDVERAFERFHLYERYGRERRVGTGLGLAIVRELAEAMGGSVGVRSAPGRGSVFVVGLRPCADDRPAAAPAAPALVASARFAQVLPGPDGEATPAA